MTQILNVISISSAHDWYFGSLNDPIGNCSAVACFALVEYWDGSGLQRTVLPLDAYSIHATGGLIGEDLTKFDKEVVHCNDLDVP